MKGLNYIWLAMLVCVWAPISAKAQISFFNMPNPDMLPAVGYSYVEYDQYQSLTGNKSVNAYVARISCQAAPFLEVGTNLWLNPQNQPDKLVVATKWRVWLYQSEKFKVSMSPGSWNSIYFHDKLAMKHLFYDFFGFTLKHSNVIYTRLMIGGYGKYWKDAKTIDPAAHKFTKGIIAGFEQRISKSLVFVTDYFQGSGEGYGLAPGFVFYAMDDGNNLPLYLAYQFDNDSKKNNLLLFEIGYTFNLFGSKK